MVCSLEGGGEISTFIISVLGRHRRDQPGLSSLQEQGPGWHRFGSKQVGDLGERFSVSHTPPWEGEAAACLEMAAGVGQGSSWFTPLVQWGQDMQSQGGPERHLHSGFQGGWMSREDVWRADTQRGLASQPGCNSPSTELDS